MSIAELFHKDIYRNINGVIKVGQQDSENIRQELEEYVVTRELDKHFHSFFDRYTTALSSPTDKMGVWISGFFGSGKSHFLKILSYLLANRELGGHRAVDYFDEQRAVKGDEGPARKVGVQVSARVRRVTNNRFSLTLVQTDAVEGRWRSRQVTVAFYHPETNAPITDVRGAELSSTSPHASERELTLRLTITTPNPPNRAFLIVRDADDESELLRETWMISLGITNDFGDF